MVRMFTLYHCIQSGSGATQTPSQVVQAALFHGVKRGREADNSPPSTAEVKNAWMYTTTSHTCSWRCAQFSMETVLPETLHLRHSLWKNVSIRIVTMQLIKSI
jgi:hypothetical protein